MNFALVEGVKCGPEPKKIGFCPYCGAEMISKCGETKIWHWAHKGQLECDPWWENETEWHRSWKALFPKEWQEIIHYSSSGEKHIADIKTPSNWVIEFQHSYLKPAEREARNQFYKNIVWVVDGKRLPRHQISFAKALNRGTSVGPAVRVMPDHYSLLREWKKSPGPVFFDFGVSSKDPERSVLWLLLPESREDIAYVFPYSRADFIQVYLDSRCQNALDFFRLMSDWPALISKYHHRLSVGQAGIPHNSLWSR